MGWLNSKSYLLIAAVLVLTGIQVAWAQEAPTPPPAGPGQPPATSPAAPTPAPPAAPAPAPPVTPAPAPPAEEVPSPNLAAIEIRGNQQTPTPTILAAVKSKVGEPFSKDQAEKDTEAIRALGWFSLVDYTTEPQAGGVKLAFTVTENLTIKQVVFKGSTAFSQQELLAAIKSRPGQVANNNTLFQDAEAVRQLYERKGYGTFSGVTGMSMKEDGTLEITVTEARIEQIKVAGNRKTKRNVIVRELSVRPGQVLNVSRLRKDLAGLINRLDLFEDVTANFEPGSEPGQVVVTVNVKERKTGLASLGIGWSSVQRFVGFIDVAESNLAGTAQRVNVRGELGGRNTVEVGYFNPWVFSPRTSLNTGVYHRVLLREAFTPDKSFLYDEKRIGGNFTFSRPFGRDLENNIFLGYRMDDVTPQARTTPLTGPLAVPWRVSSFSLTGVRDTRDIRADPTKGALYSASAEIAGLIGGGSQFNKFGGEIRHYFKIGGQRVFATRLLGGFIVGSAPPLEQFLIGGGDTLRGYREDRFPGQRMLLMNNELRFPIGSKMKAVLFLDLGSAWGGSFAGFFGERQFKLHYGVGPGIRIGTPVGLIRLDYGIGQQGSQLHFSLGQLF